MCPINVVPAGKTVEIRRLLGGRSFILKLQEMGLFPGSFVNVIQNSGGALLVSVGSSRFAIGRGMAGKIFVSERDLSK